MAKTVKRSRIRQPRTPKHEAPEVTIGNLNNQIATLIARCETLSHDNQKLERERDAARDDARIYLEGLTVKNKELDLILVSYHLIQGWQDCAREILEIERAKIRIDRQSA